ncbi:hypothetical protein EQM14_00195 [Caproiciproducens sp. NJN-50]|uniref:hypothetical protein n=1 Tax=Acutalibacteraceae TaxID=3082771 RepID=UPI000FFE2F35|nr:MULTISPECIES: hypothetical protein [Acutalibacteraceae]QAT48320.1 hypothetical protein EQM14_00195 [Caproiciproducens sp. NJN-50]
MEIVPYDGCDVLFLSRRDELAESFLRAFPQAVDLAETNQKANAMERRITELLHREAAAGIMILQTGKSSAKSGNCWTERKKASGKIRRP